MQVLTDFAAETADFRVVGKANWSKSTVFDKNHRFWLEIHGFHENCSIMISKSVDFDKNHRFRTENHGFCQNLRFFESKSAVFMKTVDFDLKIHSFCQKLQILERKPQISAKKPWILVKNCRFYRFWVCIVYPIHSFQDHMTWFLSLCTQLTPFKTIWPDFCIVYLIDSFHDHLT